MWIKLGIHKTTKHSQLKGGKRRAGTFLPAIKEVPRIKLQSWRERLRTTGRPAFGGQNLRSSRAWSRGRLTAPEQIVKARDRKSRLSIMPSCRCCETKLIHIRKRNKKIKSGFRIVPELGQFFAFVFKHKISTSRTFFLNNELME